MKKFFILPAALLAIIVAGCNKAEIDTPNEVNNIDDQYVIKAEILNNKTTYDDNGKFSWLSSDKITVVVWNDGTTDESKLNTFDHYTFSNSTGDGVTASFTGSAINSPWNELGVALYPNKNMSAYGMKDYNYVGYAGKYDTGLQVTLNQEIRPDLDNPLAVVPLIGHKNSLGVYQFNTATGILAVTVENIPADAFYLYLQDPSNSFAFSGTFALGDGDVILEADAVSPSGNAFKKTIGFTPRAAGETRTFYFPVPVGTIPAGTKLKLDKGYPGYENIMEKTINQDIEIRANHVTPLKPVSAQSWTALSGTGKFMDDNGFYATSGTSPHVDVFIEKLDGSDTEFRVVNPYQAYIDYKGKTSDVGTPDNYFYFTLKDGYVDYAKYYTSLYYYGPWYGDQYGVFYVYPSTGGSYNKWNNVVIKSDGSGSPLNVQLAPLYTRPDNTIISNSTENPKIEIVFPGSEPMMTVANYATKASVTYSDGDVTATINNAASGGANGAITAVKVVAAASLDAGVAALKAGGEMLTFTDSGTQQFSGLAGGTYYLVYKVETNGHGFTFKNGGTFMVQEVSQVTLTESMISVNVDAGDHDGHHYDGGGKGAIIDGNVSTFWHTPYYNQATVDYYRDNYNYWPTVTGTVYEQSDLDAVYGAYVQIDLNEAIQNFHFVYYVRHNNNNGEPREVKVFGSHNGTDWTPLATYADDTLMKVDAGASVELSVINASEAFEHLRFAITKAGNGATPTELTSQTGSTALAELQLFKD